ncbi:MAG: glycosyltransferase [Hyphomicrobiales bacterium]
MATSQPPLRIMFTLARVDTGGAPEHAYQLMRALKDRVEFHVACPTDRPYYQRFVALLGQDRVIEIPHRKLSVPALWRLYREVRRRKVDIMHAHGKGGGVYARAVGFLSRKKIIYTSHGMPPMDGSFFWFLNTDVWLDFSLSKFTNAVICVSSGEKDEIVAHHVTKPEKLFVIDNGVAMGSPRGHKNTAGQPLRLVAVSRFDAQKNPKELYEIVVELEQRKLAGGFHLTVLGDGDGRDEFERKIEEIGLSHRVTMTGAVPDVRKYFRENDVLVSTSIWEGMPLALLEAMSEGLPIMATDVVGNNDVVTDGENGFLYPIGNPNLGADAIMLLADSAIRQRFGDAGRNHILGGHSVEIMAEKTMCLYKNVMASGMRDAPTQFAPPHSSTEKEVA